jgi:hypothetical protein
MTFPLIPELRYEVLAYLPEAVLALPPSEQRKILR